MRWAPWLLPRFGFVLAVAAALGGIASRIPAPIAASPEAADSPDGRPTIFSWFSEGFRRFRLRPFPWLCLSVAGVLPAWATGGPLHILFMRAGLWWAETSGVQGEQELSLAMRPFLMWSGVLTLSAAGVAAAMYGALWAKALASVSEDLRVEALLRRASARILPLLGVLLVFALVRLAGTRVSRSFDEGYLLQPFFWVAVVPFLMFLVPLVLLHREPGGPSVLAWGVVRVARQWPQWAAFALCIWILQYGPDLALTDYFGLYGRARAGGDAEQFRLLASAHLAVLLLRTLVTPWVFLTMAAAFRDAFGFERCVGSQPRKARSFAT